MLFKIDSMHIPIAVKVTWRTCSTEIVAAYMLNATEELLIRI